MTQPPRTTPGGARTATVTDAPHRMGLGVLMDMPWGGGRLGRRGIGFVESDDGGGDVTDRVRAFLHRHGGDFAYAALAFQPRSRARVHRPTTCARTTASSRRCPPDRPAPSTRPS